MSVYDGLRTEQSYRHGFEDGRLQAERDLEERRPVGGIAWDLKDCLTRWEGRAARAYDLGYVRGYREVVRTLRDGRWGT